MKPPCLHVDLHRILQDSLGWNISKIMSWGHLMTKSKHSFLCWAVDIKDWAAHRTDKKSWLCKGTNMGALLPSLLAMLLQDSLYDSLDSLKIIIVHQGTLLFSFQEEKLRNLCILDEIFTSSSSTSRHMWIWTVSSKGCLSPNTEKCLQKWREYTIFHIHR